ncbi:hypothetical protein [Paraburkholderia tropica]|uniref:hypothetical protein n=1 Tax=Paraburkholderia tropica TaxID=92647 RepID=UPI003D29961F
MPLNDRVLPILEASFRDGAEVRPGRPRHFLVTRRHPTDGRQNRMAREIVIQVERDLEREIIGATDAQMQQVIGPRIQQAVTAKLVDYHPEDDGPEPFLVILGMESIGL